MLYFFANVYELSDPRGLYATLSLRTMSLANQYNLEAWYVT